ncbi:MAG: hypothetical protein ISR45_04420 [Rhodospirillales bacterium]|nr:hypothetical protein [Rhodospirillales bacterium]
MTRYFLLPLALIGFSTPVQSAEIIELTQTPCQFIDVEADQGFKSNKKADCEAINARTAKSRLEKARVLELKPGDYVFRVTNKNVPYELGFWLREKDYDWRNPLHKLSKISVSGGGLTTGVSREYQVSLKPGEYLYSCPLNTTPDYRLVVTN